jgi:hypothetical protein
MLIGSTLFAFICLILLGAYFATGGKKHILARLAGASGMLASILWIVRTMLER